MYKLMGSIILILCLVGCHLNQMKEVNQEVIETVDKTGRLEAVYSSGESYLLAANQFKPFFERYFSFSEDELLAFNKADLLANHNDEKSKLYIQKIESKLGEYLVPQLKERLKTSDIDEEVLQFPRKLLIEDVVTFAGGKVDAVEINAAWPQNQYMVYEVTVSVRQKVESLGYFVLKYGWDEHKQYYVTKEKGIEIQPVKLSEALIKRMKNERVIAEEDEIKVNQHYWVTVVPDQALRVVSVKEVNNIRLDADKRKQIMNVQHAMRVPYEAQIDIEQIALVERCLTLLLGKSREAYNDFDASYANNEVAYKALWKEWGLQEICLLEGKDFKERFKQTLNPYLEGMSQITFECGTMTLQVSKYSSKKHSRFIVTQPIKALLTNNQIVYYNYSYFVDIVDSKIQSLVLINKESIHISTSD